ncbi:MAG: metal-sulfur cluster assembly factor [Ignavibacteriales bacterium]|nr:metal-sulfur cluster assembly factor [Ignavibacteriales bacterium]
MTDHTTTVTESAVYEALRECYDPEIPVNIVDLGLVYSVTILDNWVGVKMTLTSPGCGMADMIANKVRDRIKKIPGVNDGDVRLVWQPAWHPGMMSDEARKALNVKS